jgi:hypothetical protein
MLPAVMAGWLVGSLKVRVTVSSASMPACTTIPSLATAESRAGPALSALASAPVEARELPFRSFNVPAV